MDLLLLLLLGHLRRLVLVESPADGAGLLRAEVERNVLLALVEGAKLLALLGVDDREGTGDRLANVMAVRNPVRSNSNKYACAMIALESSRLPIRIGIGGFGGTRAPNRVRWFR